jgi:hypothetical protein
MHHRETFGLGRRTGRQDAPPTEEAVLAVDVRSEAAHVAAEPHRVADAERAFPAQEAEDGGGVRHDVVEGGVARARHHRGHGQLGMSHGDAQGEGVVDARVAADRPNA